MQSNTLIVFELLVFWTVRFVKHVAPDQALQKIGHYHQGIKMQRFFKNLFIWAIAMG
jgi:hypothetical protein